MRLCLTLLFCAVAVCARGQEQERKLVQRLLEPNTTLQNSAQNKRFAGGGSVVPKAAETNQFYVPEKKLARNFSATREFAATSFSARQFATRPATVPASPSMTTFPTTAARHRDAAPESGTHYRTREFAGTRPFLERGKSQKALHALDRPLSIDDIRELLNKNE